MCYLPCFLTGIKTLVHFAKTKNCVMKHVLCLFKYSLTGAAFIRVSEWMNKNQVYFHPLVHQPTFMTNLYMTQKITNEMPVEYSFILISSQVLMKTLDIPEKKIERIYQTHCKFQIIWFRLINRSVRNFLINPHILKWSRLISSSLLS